MNFIGTNINELSDIKKWLQSLDFDLGYLKHGKLEEKAQKYFLF